MSDPFYLAFEDRFRGSRELIKRRLAIYMPLVEPLLDSYDDAASLDIGCGRGEWLELLKDARFRVRGVDIDPSMVEACLKIGLSADLGDGLAHLAAVPDSSLVVVSAFHVVEHLSFDDVRKLVSEALRTLKPGGLLIMETPNPENIVVATRSFYLDPTHLRPLPPELLSYIPEYYGFFRVKIARLQEPKEPGQYDQVRLQDVLSGVSPDYAVVAQKQGSIGLMDVFDPWFNREYGLALETLAMRFDQSHEMIVEKTAHQALQLENRVQKFEALARELTDRLERAEAQAQQAEVHAQQAEVHAQQAEVHAQQAEVSRLREVARMEQFEARAQRLEQVSEQAAARERLLAKRLAAAEAAAREMGLEANRWHERLMAVYDSNSWKMTKPLRVAKRIGTGDLSDIPKLLALVAAAFTRGPRSGERKLRNGLTGDVSSPAPTTNTSPGVQDPRSLCAVDDPGLTPRARRIHAELKAAKQRSSRIN